MNKDMQILTWFLSFSAWAGPIEFAPEFNFENEKTKAAFRRQRDLNETENPYGSSLRDQWAELIKANCPECKFDRMPDKYGVEKVRVTYPHGWWLEITLDPAVVEIVSKPATLQEFRSLETVLQRDIWKVAEKLNLKAEGSGHINIGKESAFGSDTLLFRNFLVDYLNHVELARGIHEEDKLNAPHPEDLIPEKKSQKLINLFKTFDFEKHSIEDLAKSIIDKIYTETNWTRVMTEPPEKYQSVNLSTIAHPNPWPRVELRSVRMQRNFKEFLDILGLFEKRIEFLKKIQKPLQYQAWRIPQHSYPKQMAVARYYEYVKNSGLDWNLYADLLPGQFKNAVSDLNRQLNACREVLKTTLGQ